MTDYSKIAALYSRLSVGDEDRDGGESNSIQNQKIFLENYARGQHLTNIRHYIDDDESGRFFDRSAYYHAPFRKIMTIRIREVNGIVTQRKRQQNCSCCLKLYKLVHLHRSNMGVEIIDPCE